MTIKAKTNAAVRAEGKAEARRGMLDVLFSEFDDEDIVELDARAEETSAALRKLLVSSPLAELAQPGWEDGPFEGEVPGVDFEEADLELDFERM